MKAGRNARVEVTGATQTTVNVVGTFRLLNDTFFGPVLGTPTPILNVAGKVVRVSQSSKLEAFVSAPNALFKVGRSGNVTGGFCAVR